MSGRPSPIQALRESGCPATQGPRGRRRLLSTPRSSVLLVTSLSHIPAVGTDVQVLP